MKYARIKDSHLIDVYRVPEDFADLDTLNRGLPGGGFVVVPDEAVHGAKDNGDGTFTNPSPSNPSKAPLILSASGFQDTCVAGLGGNSVGEARFGAIIRAMASSNDDLVFSIYQRFVKSTTFDRQKSGQMLTVLVQKNIANLTAQERTAILAEWPNG